MCGIAGYVQRRTSADFDVQKMIDLLRHRGPDASGVWTKQYDDWTIALGHRRLSIIDIDGGQQPMGTPDGAAQITYNGEVFNFSQLRGDLTNAGHRFRTSSDTEVVLHHCRHYGVAGL